MLGRHESYTVLHSDLFVRSMDIALDFYCERLHFSLVDDAMIRGSLVREISKGLYDEMRLALVRVSRVGAMIEILEFQEKSALTEDAPFRPLQTGLVSILVSDLDAHINRLMNHEVHPASGIFEVSLPRQGKCRIVFYNDPDGNCLEFVQTEQRDLHR